MGYAEALGVVSLSSLLNSCGSGREPFGRAKEALDESDPDAVAARRNAVLAAVADIKASSADDQMKRSADLSDLTEEAGRLDSLLAQFATAGRLPGASTPVASAVAQAALEALESKAAADALTSDDALLLVQSRVAAGAPPPAGWRDSLEAACPGRSVDAALQADLDAFSLQHLDDVEWQWDCNRGLPTFIRLASAVARAVTPRYAFAEDAVAAFGGAFPVAFPGLREATWVRSGPPRGVEMWRAHRFRDAVVAGDATVAFVERGASGYAVTALSAVWKTEHDSFLELRAKAIGLADALDLVRSVLGDVNERPVYSAEATVDESVEDRSRLVLGGSRGPAVWDIPISTTEGSRVAHVDALTPNLLGLSVPPTPHDQVSGRVTWNVKMPTRLGGTQTRGAADVQWLARDRPWWCPWCICEDSLSLTTSSLGDVSWSHNAACTHSGHVRVNGPLAADLCDTKTDLPSKSFPQTPFYTATDLAGRNLAGRLFQGYANLFFHANYIATYFRDTLGVSVYEPEYVVPLTAAELTGHCGANAFACYSVGELSNCVGLGAPHHIAVIETAASPDASTYHEYVHGQQRKTGTGPATRCDPGAEKEAAAFQEGQAFYFESSITLGEAISFDQLQSDWVTGSTTDRRYESATDFDTNFWNNPPGTSDCRSHFNGQLWSHWYWDFLLRAGPIDADKVIARANASVAAHDSSVRMLSNNGYFWKTDATIATVLPTRRLDLRRALRGNLYNTAPNNFGNTGNVNPGASGFPSIPADSGDVRADARYLAVGRVLSQTIRPASENPADKDWWWFEAAGCRTYSVSVTGMPAGTSVEARAENLAGSVLATATGLNPTTPSFTVSSTQIVYVRVGVTTGPASQFSYSVVINSLNGGDDILDGCNQGPGPGRAAVAGGTTWYPGSIEVSGDSDSFRFIVPSTQNLTAETSLGTLLDSVVDIFSVSGSWLASFDDCYENGQWNLRVAAFLWFQPGRVRCPSPTSAV